MSERVSVTIEGGVADVRLTRGEKMNALDDAMFAGIIEAGEQVSADPSVRCVVISGEGRAFCAGLDMGNFAKMASGERGGNPADSGGGEGRLEKRTHGDANGPQKAVWIWRECPVPVIAAVHGVALGGGFQVCLGADIRIVHPETKMSVLEIKWGLVPDMAGTAIMRGLARDDIVRELTYTGRIFSGTEAFELGFVTKLSDDPYKEALSLAHEIAAKNPDAIRGNKRIFNSVGQMSGPEALMQESLEQDKIIGAKNQIEAVMSQLEKRPGNYEDGR